MTPRKRLAHGAPRLHWDNVAPATPYVFDGEPGVWPLRYVFRVPTFADAIQVRVTDDGVFAALVPCPPELRGTR
jgi:hypothetical protein